MKPQIGTLLLILASVILSAGQNPRTLSTHPPPDETRRQRVAEIHGQVRLPDGTPAAGVRVFARGSTNADAKTDSLGKFQIIQLVPGMYDVYVQAVGYLPVRQRVDLETGRGTFVDITLRGNAAAGRTTVQSQPAPIPVPVVTPTPVDSPVPENARKSYEDAQRALATANDINAAVALLKTAVSEYPQYTQAYLLMGGAYSSQQNWDEAHGAFQKAVELEPKNANAWIGLGAVDNEKNNFSEAETHLLKAVELAPESADAHFELGRAYYGEGRWQSAEEQLAKANQLRPDDAQQHAFMGNILLREHNAQAALQQFQEVLRLDPNGPLAGPTRQMVERLQTTLTQSANQKQ
jgi:cytochrome c-type biogenesis protein CcmH/NrfG